MMGLYIPRTLSQAVESISTDEALVRPGSPVRIIFGRRRRRDGDLVTPDQSPSPSTHLIYKIGGSVIRDRNFGTITGVESSTPPSVSISRAIRFPDSPS
jgi:sodium/hydrogen antiporter